MHILQSYARNYTAFILWVCVTKFWENITNWVLKITGEYINIDKYIAMMGFIRDETNYVMNWLIVNIKYTTKIQKRKSNLPALQTIIKKIL